MTRLDNQQFLQLNKTSLHRQIIETNKQTNVAKTLLFLVTLSLFFHLIECDDADFEACVLPDDFLSVCVCVEWVHENEGDVRIEGLVKVLDLLNRQVQEAEVRPNLQSRTTYGHKHQITSI